MIIRCHHLREVGMMKTCCSHCHVLAGCVVHTLPNDHEAVFCCGRIAPFTPEEIETLLARIPQWEAQEKSQSLQSETPVLPDRFHPAYQAIQRLEGHERYRAAFIVGSVV